MLSNFYIQSLNRKTSKITPLGFAIFEFELYFTLFELKWELRQTETKFKKILRKNPCGYQYCYSQSRFIETHVVTVYRKRIRIILQVSLYLGYKWFGWIRLLYSEHFPQLWQWPLWISLFHQDLFLKNATLNEKKKNGLTYKLVFRTFQTIVRTIRMSTHPVAASAVRRTPHECVRFGRHLIADLEELVRTRGIRLDCNSRMFFHIYFVT